MHGGLLQCLPSRGQCWQLDWRHVSDNSFAPAYCPHVNSHSLNVTLKAFLRDPPCVLSSPSCRCPLLRVTGVTPRIAGPNVGCLRVPLKHKTLLGLYFALTTRFSSFYRKQLPRQVTGVPLPHFVGIIVIIFAQLTN